ncbi:geranylgeranylglyceryl/heptaprenylglyceryl phosphate synthase [Streptomyces sp. NPDC000134]|uniref:geranylgeranylglyceryl/heptaprenylglyceryl phosphate synthase n=1 Tax=Streptomyces sp. NPDC000134 TaxID=3364536 RepID=UPI003674881C
MNALPRLDHHTEHQAAPPLWRSGRVLARLRANPGPVHIIDPFKVPVTEAVEKAAELTKLGFAAVILASTDYESFESHMEPYVAAVKEVTPLPVVLHFPPRPGSGFPVVRGADAMLLPALLGSGDDYYVWKSFLETLDACPGRIPREEWPELILTVALTFGDDRRTGDLLGTVPVRTTSTEEIDRHLHVTRTFGFHMVYLYSRNDHVPLEVVRHFHKGLGPDQVLFVSGNVRTGRQVSDYLDSGADHVGFAGALEHPDWRATLAEIGGTRPATPARPGSGR